MKSNFYEYETNELFEKFKVLSTIFNEREVYVKSKISSINNLMFAEEYTNFHKYKIRDIRFEDTLLYIYSYGYIDKIVLRLENIKKVIINTDTLKIVKRNLDCYHEFEMKVI